MNALIPEEKYLQTNKTTKIPSTIEIMSKTHNI